MPVIMFMFVQSGWRGFNELSDAWGTDIRRSLTMKRLAITVGNV